MKNIVAIIDDGVNVLDFNENLKYDLVVKDACIKKRIPKAEYSHGTVCYYILKSFNSEYKFASIDIFDGEGKTDEQKMCVALQWCLKNNVAVINLSIGIRGESTKKSIKNLIHKLLKNGTMIFAAYSNDGLYTIPADLIGVIGIKFSDNKFVFETYNNEIGGVVLSDCPSEVNIDSETIISYNKSNSYSTAYALGKYLEGKYFESQSVKEKNIKYLEKNNLSQNNQIIHHMQLTPFFFSEKEYFIVCDEKNVCSYNHLQYSEILICDNLERNRVSKRIDLLVLCESWKSCIDKFISYNREYICSITYIGKILNENRIKYIYDNRVYYWDNEMINEYWNKYKLKKLESQIPVVYCIGLIKKVKNLKVKLTSEGYTCVIVSNFIRYITSGIDYISKNIDLQKYKQMQEIYMKRYIILLVLDKDSEKSFAYDLKINLFKNSVIDSYKLILNKFS